MVVAAFSLTPSKGADSSASDFITQHGTYVQDVSRDTTLTFTGLQTIAPSVVGSLTKPNDDQRWSCAHRQFQDNAVIFS